jgi:hypothetical protein
MTDLVGKRALLIAMVDLQLVSQWIVSLNLGLSQVFKIGNQPMSVYIGGRYYAAGPFGAPDWGRRFTLTFLFPNN